MVAPTSTKKPEVEPFAQYHKDGSIWAKGQVRGEVPVGYWQWFRKDGTIMRSGHFEDGLPVREWTTYDKNGEVFKVTDKKAGKSEQKATIASGP